MPPSINEFEDLTQFADESFDTEEVDLFEFAEDDDSPLLRLKSIVLSLDWDITDDILTELSEELANLKALWKEDKVAQIYLQGMDNVGQYLRAEGAYAHPNAIKLLLTLYYNYEKIISSPNISGESITAMLKADIRKFKVLQYQISALRKANAEEHAPEAAVEEEKKAAPAPEKAAPAPVRPDEKSNIPEPLRSMEATILGLEWEVTDEGLEKFHQEALELRQHLSGNTEAQVLVQGLQALGAYIREQTSNAHPDSFTILHSFYDALKMLLDSPNLAAEQRRQILVEQISSLNSLKDIIAKSAAVGRGGSAAPAEEETARPASEKKQAAGKKQQAAPQEEETDTSAEDGMDLEALFDDEEDDSSADELFADAAPEEKQAPPAEKAAPAKAAPHPPRPAPAAAGDDDDEWPDDALFSSGGGVMPALADEDEEGGFTAKLENDITEERAAEFDEKLDSFFDFGDEDKGGAKKQEQASAADENQPVSTSEAAKLSSSGTLDDELDSFFDLDDEDKSVSKNKEADSSFVKTPKQPEAAAGEDEDEDDLELDSFFNFDDDEPAEKIVPKIEKADRLIESAGKVETARKATPAALADDEEDEEGDEESDLDSFFNFDDEDEPAAKIDEPKQPEAAALDADEDDGLDAFFNLDEDVAAPDAEEPGSLRLDLDDAEELASEKIGGEVPEQPEAAALDADEDDGLDAFFNLDEDVAAPDAEEPGSLRLDLDDAEELDADSFFEVEEEAAETEHEETADVLSDAADDEFDSFFNMEDASAPDAEKATALGLNDAEKLAADSLFGEEEVAALSDAAEDDSGFFSSMDDHASKPDDKEMARLSLDDAEKLAADSLLSGKEASLADEEEDDDLDSFFNFDEDAPALEPEAKEADSLSLDEAEEFASDSLFGEEETPETEPKSAAAQPDAAEDEGLDSFFSMDEDAPALEPDDSLTLDEAEEFASDSLFGEEETPETEPESAAAQPELESADEGLDSFFSMDKDEDASVLVEPDDSLSVDEAADALASDNLFGEEETPETEPESAAAQPELESADEDLDSFFSMDEDAPVPEAGEADSLTLDEAEEFASDSLFGEEETPETELESAAALPELESADEDLDSFFSMDEDAPALEPDDSLSVDEAADALASDSLFGEEETPETEPKSAAALPELESADEDLDSFFSMDEDAPALEPEAGEADSLTLDEAEELSADSFFGDTPAETEEDLVPSELESADEGSDDFFGMEDAQSAASEETAQKGIDQEQATEIKEKLDSLFSFDDDALTDEGIPQTDDPENGFMMPFAAGEHGDEAPKAEEDIFSESDKSAVFEFDDDAEDNVFAIAQGGDEVPSVFAEESELDSLFEEQADETAGDDAFADVQDEPQAEDVDIFTLAQQDAADGDFLTALKERENAVEEEEDAALLQAKAEEELILGKEYEDTEGVFSQLAQDAVPDAFEESAQAAGTEHSAGAASASVFSSLALAAAALTAAPSAHNLQQISELAAAARQEEAVPPNKIILLHLLDSSSAMLAKAPGGKAANSGTALVQELAAGLDAADEPGKLPEIISRYTAWQQDFFEQLMTDIPRPVSRPAAGLEQLQDEVTQLKQYLINEIRLFRQELGKR